MLLLSFGYFELTPRLHPVGPIITAAGNPLVDTAINSIISHKPYAFPSVLAARNDKIKWYFL
jgi:hypothetical protein